MLTVFIPARAVALRAQAAPGATSWTKADERTVYDYRLTMDNVKKMVAMVRQVGELTKKNPKLCQALKFLDSEGVAANIGATIGNIGGVCGSTEGFLSASASGPASNCSATAGAPARR